MKVLKENLNPEEYEKFNLKECLDILYYVDGITIDDLFDSLIITEEEVKQLKSDIESVERETIEKIYNYCYNHNIFINDILWIQEKEDLPKSNILLAHGSRFNIKGNIRLDASGDSNDFANGFYCGENLKQAGMFVSGEPESSLYIISLDPSYLKAARFNVSTNWMLAVAYYRETIDEYKNHPRIKNIISKIEECDYIIAPIADNRMFQIIDAFIGGEITDAQCKYALSATNLGFQYVFKNKKALEHLSVLNHLYLCKAEKNRYNIFNQEESNTSLNKAIVAKKKFANVGNYIQDIL